MVVIFVIIVLINIGSNYNDKDDNFNEISINNDNDNNYDNSNNDNNNDNNNNDNNNIDNNNNDNSDYVNMFACKHQLFLFYDRLVSGSDDFTLFLWNPTEDKKPLCRMTGKRYSSILNVLEELLQDINNINYFFCNSSFRNVYKDPTILHNFNFCKT